VLVGPTQPVIVGVIVTVPVIAPADMFVAVNAGVLVTPLPLRPIAVLEFVHVKVAPAGALLNVFAGTLAPGQTVMFDSATTVGKGVTVTVDIAVLLQDPNVPVTVYVVVPAGVTLIGFKEDPVDQEYVVPPPAVRVAEVPAHIVGELTVIVGNGITVTVATAVAVQPFTLVPVTV
jgi:hypothetical protein